MMMLLYCIALWSQLVLAETEPAPITPIDLGFWSTRSSEIESVRVEEDIYFTSYHPDGRELWFSDGTAAGTRSIGVYPDIEFYQEGSELLLLSYRGRFDRRGSLFRANHGELIELMKTPLNGPRIIVAGYADNSFYYWNDDAELYRIEPGGLPVLIYDNAKGQRQYALPVRSGGVHYLAVREIENNRFYRLEPGSEPEVILSLPAEGALDIARVGPLVYLYYSNQTTTRVHYYDERDGSLREVPFEWRPNNLAENPIIPYPGGIVLTHIEHSGPGQHFVVVGDVVSPMSLPANVGLGRYIAHQRIWYFLGENHLSRFAPDQRALIPLHDDLLNRDFPIVIGSDGYFYLLDKDANALRSNGYDAPEPVNLPYQGAAVLQQVTKGMLISYRGEPGFLEEDGTFTLMDLNPAPGYRVPETGQLFKDALYVIDVENGHPVLKRIQGRERAVVTTLDMILDPTVYWPDNAFEVVGDRLVIRLPDEDEHLHMWISDGTALGTERFTLPDNASSWQGFPWFIQEGQLWTSDWKTFRPVGLADDFLVQDAHLYFTHHDGQGLTVSVIGERGDVQELGTVAIERPEYQEMVFDEDVVFIRASYSLADWKLIQASPTDLTLLGDYRDGKRAGSYGTYLFSNEGLFLMSNDGLRQLSREEDQIRFSLHGQFGLYIEEDGDLWFQTYSQVYHFDLQGEVITRIETDFGSTSGQVLGVVDHHMLLYKGAMYSIDLEAKTGNALFGWILRAHLLGQVDGAVILYSHTNYRNWGDQYDILRWDGNQIEVLQPLNPYIDDLSLFNNVLLLGNDLYFRGFTWEAGLNWWHRSVAEPASLRSGITFQKRSISRRNAR